MQENMDPSFPVPDWGAVLGLHHALVPGHAHPGTHLDSYSSSLLSNWPSYSNVEKDRKDCRQTRTGLIMSWDSLRQSGGDKSQGQTTRPHGEDKVKGFIFHSHHLFPAAGWRNSEESLFVCVQTFFFIWNSERISLFFFPQYQGRPRRRVEARRFHLAELVAPIKKLDFQAEITKQQKVEAAQMKPTKPRRSLEHARI